MSKPNLFPTEAIAPSSLDIFLEITAAIAFVGSIAIVIPFWHQLPDSIPIHFGITGEPNVWAPKATTGLFPAIGIISYFSLTLTSLFPHTFNYPVPITEENAADQARIALKILRWMKAELLGMFVWIQWEIFQVALGKTERLSIAFLSVFLLLLFGTVGFYLRQAYAKR